MSECPYIPQEQRAAWLIEKGVRAWQQIQRLAITEDELFDSIVLLGQELWLPHHETDPTRYFVTLRIGLHFPDENRQQAAERAYAFFQALETEMSDDRGSLKVAVEVR